MWILTAEINSYDQFGEYFLAAWEKKPAPAQFRRQLDAILASLDLDFEPPRHSIIKGLIECGGGRQHTEDLWFRLREVEPAVRCKPTFRMIEP